MSKSRKKFLLDKVAKFSRIDKRRKIVSIDFDVLDNLNGYRKKWALELRKYGFLVQSAIPCEK